MEESKISTRTLTIDGMTGDACIAKVTAALKTVPEITDQNVKVGSASFSCDGSHCTQARAAIEKAGFRVRGVDSSSETKPSAQPAKAGSNFGSDASVGNAKTPPAYAPSVAGAAASPAAVPAKAPAVAVKP